jgi:hypothetical protein
VEENDIEYSVRAFVGNILTRIHENATSGVPNVGPEMNARHAEYAILFTQSHYPLLQCFRIVIDQRIQTILTCTLSSVIKHDNMCIEIKVSRH